ncbi:MAG: T9SS type A sorting domain-containing protein [Bacteroidia bacterium]|nr:T9SS type A sorting domain-containing protein [Bacteroidia bacterium]
MKVLSIFILSFFALGTFLNQINAQTVFSRFDFNSLPLTSATTGPNATYIDPDYNTTGNYVYVASGCNSWKGMDLALPNTGGILDQPQLGMTFKFRKRDSRSHFFDRGGMSFYLFNNRLYVQYKTENGFGGSTTYGPFNTNIYFNNSNSFHEITFVYYNTTGMAEISVDGNVLWSHDGPNNRDLDWTGAGEALIGYRMKDNCHTDGFLDYFYLFNPAPSLPVDFLSFEVTSDKGNAQLNWVVDNEKNNDFFTVESSLDGENFIEMEFVPSVGDGGPNSYSATARNLKMGRNFFRIRQTDKDGTFAFSEIKTVEIASYKLPALQVFPNPSQGKFSLIPGNSYEEGALRILDLQGNVVYQSSILGTREVNLESVEPGIYFAEITTGQTRETCRIMIR